MTTPSMTQKTHLRMHIAWCFLLLIFVIAMAIPSGDSATFTLTAAGTYPFYCETHTEHGMFGAVFVVP